MADLDTGRRFVIADGAPLFREPGRSGFAKLARGQAVQVGRREGDFVRVQPVDANGRPSGSPGWISGSQLGTGKPGGSRVRVGGQDYVVGSAGRAILEGRVGGGYHECAVTAQQAGGLPSPIGEAHNYANPRHPNALMHHGYDEVRGGDWRPDDVVVYGPTESNGAGHVGFAAMKNGQWGVVSNLNGHMRWHRLSAVGGRVSVWRKRR